MAGHSKWANIQHRKGRQDEKRGKWTPEPAPGQAPWAEIIEAVGKQLTKPDNKNN